MKHMCCICVKLLWLKHMWELHVKYKTYVLHMCDTTLTETYVLPVYYMYESCHTYERYAGITCYIWNICVAYVWHYSDWNICVTCKLNVRVMSHLQNHMWEVHECVMSHIWMSHVAHMNEYCHTYEWVMSHMCNICGSDMEHPVMRPAEKIMSRHTWMCHVTHMNESCHTCEWVMSHIWMSHVTHSDKISKISEDILLA